MGEEYRFWLFQPNYTSESNLRPFFYSAEYTFYGETTFDNVSNTDDWYKYLKGKASKKDINDLLNHTDPATFYSKSDSLAYNSFYKISKSRPEIWAYLKFAKKVENMELGGANTSWYCEECPNLSFSWKMADEVNVDGLDLSTYGNELYTKTNDRFIKERIAYQLVRLTGESSESEKIYTEKLLPVQSESWVKYAALLRAASYKHTALADYQLSQVFDHCVDKAYRTVQLFENHPEAINYTKNNHEKAVLKTMHLMQEPFRVLPELKKVNALDPGNKHLGMLLVREINKIEDWLLTPRYTEYTPSVYKYPKTDDEYAWYLNRFNKKALAVNLRKDSVYAREVQYFIESIINSNTRKDVALLHLSAGYLAYVNRDLINAREHYDLVKKSSGFNPEIAFQLELHQLTLSISENKQTPPELEARAWNIIKNLEPDNVDYSWNAQPRSLRDQLFLMLGRLYIEKGNLARGILTIGQSNAPFGDFYNSIKGAHHLLLELGKPADYEAMIALIKKKNKTNFEKEITKNTFFPIWGDWDTPKEGWDTDKILDLKSIYYIREDQLDSAYQTVTRIEDCYWNQYPYDLFTNDDPFLVLPWNTHSSYNINNKKYTKTTFLRELIALKKQAEAATGNHKAKLLYKIGNAYFSMTWRGKYWIMSSTFNSSQEVSTKPALQSASFINYYYKNKRAQHYFEAAAGYATNKELKALSINMAVECCLDVDFNTNGAPSFKKYRSKFGKNTLAEEIQSNCELFHRLMVKYYGPKQRS